MNRTGRLEAAAAAGDAEEVSSPCISVCQLGDDGICEGCLRTMEEIAAWPAMDHGARIRLLWELDMRRKSAYLP